MFVRLFELRTFSVWRSFCRRVERDHLEPELSEQLQPRRELRLGHHRRTWVQHRGERPTGQFQLKMIAKSLRTSVKCICLTLGLAIEITHSSCEENLTSLFSIEATASDHLCWFPSCGAWCSSWRNTTSACSITSRSTTATRLRPPAPASSAATADPPVRRHSLLSPNKQ